MKNPFIRYILFCVSLNALFVSFSADKPNIVFIMADDMGSGDVQALNANSTIPTPNLNRLANEGMTFTDAHSPSAVCTPTRYGVMTGRYCWRSSMVRGVLNGYGSPLIETDRETVASALKKVGYATGVVGKWHLGLGFQKTDGEWDWSKTLDYSPNDVGFDHSFVIPASLDFPPYVYVEGHEITGEPDRIQPKQSFPAYLREGELGSDFSIVDCLDRLTEEAADYIRKQAKRDDPFFLYFPLSAPHKPAWPHPRFDGRSGLGPYGDFVIQADETVGKILDTIDEMGITDNTLVIYTSDNGSYMYRYADPAKVDHVEDTSVQGYYEGNHTANGPFRGTKADIWEAGHRVPFFVRWPGKVEAGSSTGRTITHTDFFATAVSVAGGEMPNAVEAAQDSFDFSPLFLGNEKAFKRAPVINHSGGAMFAIREGDWKLVLGNGSGGREKPSGKRFDRPWQLFNLKEDIGETTDRIREYPEVAQALEKKALELMSNGRSR
jgi:arylsulfatase A|tara:strand:- start:218 stop:1696 length:1479 start_codon:yes stop_codon:yes gene_type:complete